MSFPTETVGIRFSVHALRPAGSEVVGSSALAFWEEVAACDEFAEAEFEGAGFAAGELDDLAEGAFGRFLG